MLPGSHSNNSRRLRLAIATTGRFHVFDLARELAALGHDVRLYSMLTNQRAEQFGISRDRHCSLLPYVWPLVGWGRYSARILPTLQNWLFARGFDRILPSVLDPCDVLIAMSGTYVSSLVHARNRFSAQIWLERGSRHISSQAEILSKLPNARKPSQDAILRELTGYSLADKIVVPAAHVVKSFERDPSSARKLIINPYGTNLEMFPYITRRTEPKGKLRLVFAGTWSLRKGCDILIEAIKRNGNAVLTHVGTIGDCDFPFRDLRFNHLGAVPQSHLHKIYAENDAFIHASREEGLSTVLVQALSTGLPIICTDRTGGADLAHTALLERRILVVPADDVCSLQNAISKVERQLSVGYYAALPDSERETLSWKAYALRYHRALVAYIPTAD